MILSKESVLGETIIITLYPVHLNFNLESARPRRCGICPAEPLKAGITIERYKNIRFSSSTINHISKRSLGCYFRTTLIVLD